MSPAKPRKLTPRQEAASVDTPPDRLRELANTPKLARLVEAKPSTSAELLLELSSSEEKAVCQPCISNAILQRSGGTFPLTLRARSAPRAGEGNCGKDPAGAEVSGHHQLSLPITPGFSQGLLGTIQQAVGCIGF